MTIMDLQDALNRRTMSADDVVREYAGEDKRAFTPAERAATDYIAEVTRGRAILDLGVGGGRTVKPLLALSEDYLGIDYSELMVAACKRKYPGVRFARMDARAMDHIADASIFFSLFSMNGLSMVGHADRLCILREIHRVLEPGGWFLFSTYNHASPDATRGFRFPPHHLSAARSPVAVLRCSARFAVRTVVGLRNRSRYWRHEERGPGYAIVNDRSHDYATMLYYVDMEEQRAQLADAGFAIETIRMWERSGAPTDSRTTDSSVTFLVQKPR
jgi:SAM-dependent methyltransferase